jgi:vesicular inhibitory amino acid transporter
MVLLVKALLSYPLPYFATVQLMRDNYFRGTDRTAFAGCFGADGKLREWALSLRICLVLCILFTALSVPYFVLLMGLIGNITGTMLSFVWPCIFHLQLKGAQLPQSKRITDMCIIGVGVLIGAVGIYYSSAQLIAAFNQIDEYE